MEQIERAIRYASAKKQKLIFVLLLCGVCITILALLEQLEGSIKIVIAVLSAAVVLIAVILWLLNIKSEKLHSVFMHSRTYRALEKLGYAHEFLDSIDAEMQNNIIIKYNYNVYRLNLFVTKTWLIFISANGSVIRKVSDISKIYREFLPTRSRDVIRIEFIDGSTFANMCDFACDDIIALFEKEFPTIVAQPIRRGLIIFSIDIFSIGAHPNYIWVCPEL